MANRLSFASASGEASAESTPISVKTNGPCTLRTRQPGCACTPAGTRPSSQTTESSSPVRVMEKNEPCIAHSGMGTFGASRDMAKRSRKRVSSNRRGVLAIKLKQAPDKATIHGDGGAGDIACALGSKESNDGGEFLRRAEALRGDFAFPTGEHFLRLGAGARRDGGSESIEAGGTRVAGANVIHGDAVSSVFICERAGKPGDSGAYRIGKQQAVNGLLHR